MTPRKAWIALLSLCAGLAVLIAAEVAFAVIGDGATPPPSRNAAPAPSKAAAPDTSAMIAEILERPLFSRTRAPHEAEVAEEEPEEKGPPQLESRLTGIMVGPQGREALFQNSGGDPVALKEGGEIDGWKVAAIRTAEVVLASDFGEQVVKLTDGEGDGAPARPPAKKKPVATKIKATKAAAPAANAARPAAQAGAAAKPGQKPAPVASANRGRQGAK